MSPDGRLLSFIGPLHGVPHLWVGSVEHAFDEARPLAPLGERATASYAWSRDGRFLIYCDDSEGDENYNLLAVATCNRAAPAPPRHLTSFAGVRARIFEAPRTDPDLLYIGLNDRDTAWHDLYELRISSGERRLIHTNTEHISDWIFDRNGHLRLAVRHVRGATQLLALDAGEAVPIFECESQELLAVHRFHPGGQHLYATCNRGTDVDLSRLVLIDGRSGAEELIECDPEQRVDFGSAIFCPRTDRLVGTVYVDDQPRVYWRDERWKSCYEHLRAALGGRAVKFLSMSADGDRMLVSCYADTEPGEIYFFDAGTRKLTFLYQVLPQMRRVRLAPMSALRYCSRDGLEIPAYLTLPVGRPPKSLPAVIVVHGGPASRDSWGFQPFVQFLANRGYAVLSPNFRGSSGYGKRFRDAGDRQWGERMQDDLTAGVACLVSSGIVDRDRVAIVGSSYGGYAALAGLAFTPGIYAAGICLNGPPDLVNFVDSMPSYWEAAREQLLRRIGDPREAGDRARLRRVSPINAVAAIKAPLLVIQGARDARVPRSDCDALVAALHRQGAPVEYLVAPDEGHVFVKPRNHLATLAAIETFLARHLRGECQRQQGDVLTSVQQLTVDPASL